MEVPEKSKDLEQDESDFDPTIVARRRGARQGQRGGGGFHNRRPQGRRENNYGNRGFGNMKVKFPKFYDTSNLEDYFQWEHEA